LKSFFIVAKNERVTYADYYGLFSGTGGSAKACLASSSSWYVGEDVTNVYKNNVDTDVCGNDLAAFYFEMGANKNEVYQIGRERTISTRNWLGPVLRIIGYSGILGASDRAAVFNYLIAKYSIT